MRKSIYVLGLGFVLSACATDQALVTGFNGDSVNIQTSQIGGSEAFANAQKEASRLCGMRGFSGAEFASVKQNNNTYVNDNLFICTNGVAASTRFSSTSNTQSGSYFSKI